MGLLSFIKGIFNPTPEYLENVRQSQKLSILAILYKYRIANGYMSMGAVPLYSEFRKKWRPISFPDFIQMTDELARDGFVQRIDGGDKEIELNRVYYIISENGINHLSG